MAAARPVIASEAGGIPEMVEHGVTGLLFTPGDPNALGRAIERLLGDPAAAASMGEQGRTRVDSQALDRVLDRLETIYRGLLDRPRREAGGPDRPTIALEDAVCLAPRPEITEALGTAEARAGALHLVRWSESRPGARAPRSPSTADLLLLTAEADPATVAEALACDVPFVVLTAAGTRLERLAAASGAGVAVPTPLEAGEQLAALLRDGSKRRRMAARGRDYLAGLESAGRAAASGASLTGPSRDRRLPASASG
jgi:glycosyltransferase involved in cell wall biosynthesis